MGELIQRIKNMSDLHIPESIRDEIWNNVLARDGGPKQTAAVAVARKKRAEAACPQQASAATVAHEADEEPAGPAGRAEGSRRRLRAKTAVGPGGSYPPAKSARTDLLAGVVADGDAPERPAKSARVGSPRSTPGFDSKTSSMSTSDVSMPPAAVVPASTHGGVPLMAANASDVFTPVAPGTTSNTLLQSSESTETRDKSSEAAAAAEARRKAERERGLGPDAAALHEHRSGAGASEVFGESRRDQLRRDLEESRRAAAGAGAKPGERADLAATQPDGDGAASSSGTSPPRAANCSTGVVPAQAQPPPTPCSACGCAGCSPTSPTCAALLLSTPDGALEVLDWARGTAYPVSRALQRHMSSLTTPSATTAWDLRSIEFGGEGDCLFYSIAGILARMVLKGGPPARHVLQRIPPGVFLNGKSAVMRRLREMSAQAFQTWTPEQVLNFVLSKIMQSTNGTFQDDWGPWDPLRLLQHCGFSNLAQADTVSAFQPEQTGDAHVRLDVTVARPGGARHDPIVLVPSGCRGLQQLRDELTRIHSWAGNYHWGDQTDVERLSDALDVGILLFRNTLPPRTATCLYNIGSQRENFPHWIALWWEDPVHFRAAQLLGDVCWSANEVPQTLRDQYAVANRLAN